MTDENTLKATPMLDFHAPEISALVAEKGWLALTQHERIGAAYDFVRNDIRFGYNVNDLRRASEVLADGYGQCNTKATLLMALLRALGVPCRLHGFTIHKRLQRGVVPEVIYKIAPDNILHSWIEVFHEENWIALEGFILDAPMIRALQSEFAGREALCGYGAGTDCLPNPKVEWTGVDTYIQKTGINQDFGVFEAPDAFYKAHQQDFRGLRALIYRYAVRHVMNKRVEAIRQGKVPRIPGF